MDLRAIWEYFLNGEGIGGLQFIAPALALNIATTNWKTFQEHLKVFELDLDKILSTINRVEKMEYVNSNNRDLLRNFLEHETEKLREAHKIIWSYTRKFAGFCAFACFVCLFYGKQGPFTMLLVLPLPSQFVWKKFKCIKLKRNYAKKCKTIKELHECPTTNGLDKSINEFAAKALENHNDDQ
ncbi:MAG: hypothetical protein JJU29_09695 [Verrucomicrobia bacterium]|nr:hypothetical protein [Verrucomicrobiota bacterium]MCH8511535.1 hypothetical protein [Kiritimatiellia bacterium]